MTSDARAKDAESGPLIDPTAAERPMHPITWNVLLLVG